MEAKRIFTKLGNDCWKLAYLERGNGLNSILFVCDEDPQKKTLQEILKMPRVRRDLTIREFLQLMGGVAVPKKKRVAKKRLNEIIHTKE